MLSACRYAINSGSAAEKIDATKDILYEGGGPNWTGRLKAFDGKIYRWGAGSEYGSWLFRVYEYFEYTDKIAGIGFVHILYQPFTAEETLLCRADTFRFMAGYNNVFNELHTLNGMVGTEYSSVRRTANTWTGWGYQFDNGGITYTPYLWLKQMNEENTEYFGESYTLTNTLAYYGQVNYNYDQRYTLNGTIRYEGTNRLGKSRQSRWLPTWNISGSYDRWTRMDGTTDRTTRNSSSSQCIPNSIAISRADRPRRTSLQICRKPKRRN